MVSRESRHDIPKSVCLFVFLFIIYLSIYHLSSYLLSYLFIHSSIHLPIYPSIYHLSIRISRQPASSIFPYIYMCIYITYIIFLHSTFLQSAYLYIKIIFSHVNYCYWNFPPFILCFRYVSGSNSYLEICFKITIFYNVKSFIRYSEKNKDVTFLLPIVWIKLLRMSRKY